MPVELRRMRDGDHDAVVELALRIWTPVFASVNGVLGEPLATLLHGDDWRDYQAADVRRLLRDGDDAAGWVAVDEGDVVGFSRAVMVDPARRIGEVAIVGVDPAHQREGLGRRLVEGAVDWMRDHGYLVAVISTGGDPGHAAARGLYGAMGFTPLPGVQYFRSLVQS